MFKFNKLLILLLTINLFGMGQIQDLSFYPDLLNEEACKILLNQFSAKKNDSVFRDKNNFVTAFEIDLVKNMPRSFLVFSEITKEGYLLDKIILDDIVKQSQKNYVSSSDFLLENIKKFENIKSVTSEVSDYLSVICKEKINVKTYKEEDYSRINGVLKEYFISIKSDRLLCSQFVFNIFFLVGEVLRSKVGGEWRVNFDLDFKHRPYVFEGDTKYDYFIWFRDLKNGKYSIDINEIIKTQLFLNHKIIYKK